MDGFRTESLRRRRRVPPPLGPLASLEPDEDLGAVPEHPLALPGEQGRASSFRLIWPLAFVNALPQGWYRFFLVPSPAVYSPRVATMSCVGRAIFYLCSVVKKYPAEHSPRLLGLLIAESGHEPLAPVESEWHWQMPLGCREHLRPR